MMAERLATLDMLLRKSLRRHGGLRWGLLGAQMSAVAALDSETKYRAHSHR